MSTIRMGTNTDYDDAADFAIGVLAELGKESTREMLIQSFRDHQADPTCLWLVARDADGKVVGTVGVELRDGGFFSSKHAMVEAIAVRPESRGSLGRVGGELLRHAETWAQLQGAERLMLGIPDVSPMVPPVKHGYQAFETLYAKEISR